MKKSHEYISKVILRGFSFKEKNVRYTNYVRIPKTIINKQDIDSFNTRLGAYSDANEDILDKEFESYLGDLKAKIRNVGRKKGSLKTNDFILEKIKNYFAYQCIRDDIAMKRLFSAYVSIATACGRPVPDVEISCLKNFFIDKESETHVVRSLFDNHKIVIKYDNNGGFLGTNYIVNFLLTEKCDTVGISLSPEMFLVLTSDFSSQLLLKYAGLGYDDVTGTSDVDYINKRMVEVGYNRGGGFLISDDKNKIKKYTIKKQNNKQNRSF